ncbi:MAG TPA: hypothetical protein VF914_21645 [Chloroflexia bacterium]|jgi:hypothetical protein
MAGVLIKAERVSDQLIKRGKALQKLGDEVRKLIEDGVVDEEELQRLFRIAGEAEELGGQVEDAALDVQDVAADILHAKQVLTLGRHATPNRHLQDHCAEVDRQLAAREFEGAEKSFPPEGQEESPAMFEIEGLQTSGKLAA